MSRDRYGDEREEGDAAPSRAAVTPPRPPAWEDVPAGTIGRTCRGGKCGKWVYWIERRSTAKKGKNVGKLVKVPVDCDVDGGRRPTRTDDGKGINHYTNCPDAAQF